MARVETGLRRTHVRRAILPVEGCWNIEAGRDVFLPISPFFQGFQILPFDFDRADDPRSLWTGHVHRGTPRGALGGQRKLQKSRANFLSSKS